MELISAVISLAGVLASAIISYFITRQQTSQTEYQVRSAFTGKLYEKRLEIYPHLYHILSDLVKLARTKRLTQLAVEDAIKKMTEWDSRCAIFVSAVTHRQLILVRRVLSNLAILPESNLLLEETYGALLEAVSALEIALKTELGVFEVEGYHNPENVKTWDEIWQQMDSRKRK